MDSGRRWAPNAMHAALACVPVALVAAGVAGAGSGLVLGRADLAAAGTGAALLGLTTERIRWRNTRRALRQDRSALRRELRRLNIEVTQLRRELATLPTVLPAVLRPEPPSPAGTGSPAVVVEAFDRAASPPTPRSLPILTSNRRGLQFSAPAEPLAVVSVAVVPVAAVPVAVHSSPLLGQPLAPVPFPVHSSALPAQRPPATPITGLPFPPVEPGPAVPVISLAWQPAPGPRDPITGPLAVIDIRARPTVPPSPFFTPGAFDRECA